ncbi:hypothetical protein FB45DRAFT_307184 [Roridomyces roridus]|uniref:Cyclin N-terminal domain-containing protein n=1 Tax=Roridomyces roridus TaxID=1738132 RepID=A0AAD7B6E4_9AGAR|nr:hypothetical protein FB45DRAFT_307184 [Roridomyces roridus]
MYSPASSSSSSSSSPSSASSSYGSWSPSRRASPKTPVHAASLVDPSIHSPQLLQLVDIKLSNPVIEYVVECVAEIVEHALSCSGVQVSRGRSSYRRKFTVFVTTTLTRAEVSCATILVALAYMARARPHLSIALEKWALERVFLGALITASKYTNDSSLKNVHWALCSGVFSKRDVGRIEREFLDVLDWQLGVTEADVLAHHEGLVRAAAVDARPLTVRNAAPEVDEDCTARVLPPRFVPRGRHHRRLSTTPCPALEPSSPQQQSSAGSSSPRTPITITHLTAARPPNEGMDVEKGPARFRGLVRAFPIPVPLRRVHAHQPL